MRFGFTTGSCATAAAKAASYMLLTGKRKEKISIHTPKGLIYHADICEIKRKENKVSCAVIKDGGDDPDMTSGAHIFAEVSYLSEFAYEKEVRIEGGKGVGIVTKPGLDQAVGMAAINHVPREMITKEVREIMDLCDYKKGLLVRILVPEGEEIAKKTFNPKLGILGGISILGTSGVVEPMSTKAILDTILVELRQKKALGFSIAAVSPGNYGLDFMKKTYGYDLDKSVKCSNFIGDTIDMAMKLGFKKMLLTGHIGKLVKVSGGIMNTHSKEGDCRMELLSAVGLLSGLSAEKAREILQAVSTEEGIRILEEADCLEESMDFLMEKILFYLNRRGKQEIQIECILYSNQYGCLAKSAGADAMLEQLKRMEQ